MNTSTNELARYMQVPSPSVRRIKATLLGTGALTEGWHFQNTPQGTVWSPEGVDVFAQYCHNNPFVWE